MQWDAGLWVCWAVGLKVSSAAGGQPLPTQPGGQESCLLVAEESWPLQRPLGPFPSPGEAAAGCSHILVGLPGSKLLGTLPSLSQAHVAPCCCQSFLCSLAGSTAWGPAGSGAVLPSPHASAGGCSWLPGRGAALPEGMAWLHGAVSLPRWLGAPAIPPGCESGTGCSCSQLECWHADLCPQPRGMLLGSSPLERTAWPVARASHPECHLAHVCDSATARSEPAPISPQPCQQCWQTPSSAVQVN